MRHWLGGAALIALGVELLSPAAAAADWYWRPWRAVHTHRRVVVHDHDDDASGFFLGALLGAAAGIAVDRELQLQRERDREKDREVSHRPEPGDRNVALRAAPAKTTDLRFEYLRDRRVKIAWLGDERGIRYVELFTADAEKRTLQRERLGLFPFAATFDEPAADGYLGVTLVYSNGERVTRLVPANQAAR